MDPATIQRILSRQGAQDTPENVNRIMAAAASDPSILEKYSMGTAPAQMSNGYDVRGGGGVGDNSALLKLAIDKSMGMNMPEQAPAPQAMEAPAAPPAPVARAPMRPTGTPGMAPDMNAENQNLGPVPPRSASPGEQSAGQGNDWLLPMLTSILGLRAVAPSSAPPMKALPRAIDNNGLIEGANPSQKRLTGPDTAQPKQLTYQPKLENNAPSTTRNSPELEKAGEAKAGRTAAVAEDVAGDNRAQAAQEAMDAKKLQDQMRTRETLKAAKNVGRTVRGR